MTSVHRRYLATEVLIGAAINGVLSAAFVLLVFGGQSRVAAADLVMDALPQSFMVALMSAVVPTLLTRKRVRGGVVPPLSPMISWLPRNVGVRAICTALVVTVVAGIVHWAVLGPMAGVAFPFASVLIAKVAYGAALGAAITAWSVRNALADRTAEQQGRGEA
jgi:hypothetical protein